MRAISGFTAALVLCAGMANGQALAQTTGTAATPQTTGTGTPPGTMQPSTPTQTTEPTTSTQQGMPSNDGSTGTSQGHHKHAMKKRHSNSGSDYPAPASTR